MTLRKIGALALAAIGLVSTQEARAEIVNLVCMPYKITDYAVGGGDEELAIWKSRGGWEVSFDDSKQDSIVQLGNKYDALFTGTKIAARSDREKVLSNGYVMKWQTLIYLNRNTGEYKWIRRGNGALGGKRYGRIKDTAIILAKCKKQSTGDRMF